MTLTTINFFLLVTTQKNFNIFRMPLNFLSAIYNREISLKEAEISQQNLEKKNRRAEI